MQDIDALFRQFLRGQCSPEEADYLLDLFGKPEGEPLLARLMEQELDAIEPSPTGSKVPFAMAENLEKLRDRLATPERKRRPTIYRLWPYAAAMVLIFAVGIWGWPRLGTDGKTPESSGMTIVPGGNRATLTWGDGQTVPLSEAQHGISVGDIVAYADGTPVSGIEAMHPEVGDTAWMALTTPRGGTYHVTLADGSRVWLNAASTLKYPARFDGDERVVELHGEGYFEVAENRRKPFRVISERQQVVVLGTAFNITSYADEAEIKTTLVEGKVHVSLNQRGNPMSLALAPSEQARLVGGRLSKRTADVNVEVAWRNGLFAFRNEKLGDIMRKVARWYDVEVVFEGDIASRTFSGTVSRYADIGELLETLALTDKVQFELDGKTIAVKPK